MNKKYYDFNMKVTQEQFDNDLKKGLKDIKSFDKIGTFKNFSHLVFREGKLCVGGTASFNQTTTTEIPYYNPELFLALVKATTDEELQVGDFVVTDGYSKNYDGRVLQINEVNCRGFAFFNVFDGGYWETSNNFEVGLPRDRWRKATLQEIVATFKDRSYSTKSIKESPRPTYIITAEQAQSIIDIACNNWKTNLGKKWSLDIVLKNDITISNDFYKKMLVACNIEQKELFKTIFKEKVLSIRDSRLYFGDKFVGRIYNAEGGGVLLPYSDLEFYIEDVRHGKQILKLR